MNAMKEVAVRRSMELIVHKKYSLMQEVFSNPPWRRGGIAAYTYWNRLGRVRSATFTWESTRLLASVSP